MTLMQRTLFENTAIRQIEAGDAWVVSLVADSSTFVEVECSAYLEPYLKVRLEGTKLEIGFAERVYPLGGSVYRAIVHTAQLEAVAADDAATVQCTGRFAGQDICIGLAGAATCNNLAFEGTSCEIKLDDASVLAGFQFVGSSCKAELDDASQCNARMEVADHIDIVLDGKSRFVSKGGTTATARLNLQNASLLNMAETQVGQMQVELGSGSEATVHVTETLSGTLTAASTMYYKGQPRINIDCTAGSQLIPF